MTVAKLHRRIASETDLAQASRNDSALPTFIYDDCCPLCKGYTSVFTKLGWAERQGFSTIDDDTMNRLDFATARHQIPLVSSETSEVAYGLDGIIGLVENRLRFLRPLLRWQLTRRILDRAYWFITYNRRHIVAAAPPAEGIDCAPDFNRKAVLAYITLCAIVATTHSLVAGTHLTTVGSLAAATLLVTNRDLSRPINAYQAAGHVGSVVAVSAGAGTIAFLLGGNLLIASVAVAAVATRKIWLRRWMIRPA